MENLLEVKNLAISFKTFFGEVEAVRDISFTVKNSETVAIVGESGCGKSVTANSIMQLLPTPPAFIKGGEIVFEGEDLLKKTQKEIIEITEEQMYQFAGNMLQVEGKDGQKFLVMSQTAYDSLTKKQIKKIEKHNPIISVNIPTIEKLGGGSARCMMAEIFLPKA